MKPFNFQITSTEEKNKKRKKSWNIYFLYNTRGHIHRPSLPLSLSLSTFNLLFFSSFHNHLWDSSNVLLSSIGLYRFPATIHTSIPSILVAMGLFMWKYFKDCKRQNFSGFIGFCFIFIFSSANYHSGFAHKTKPFKITVVFFRKKIHFS